MIKVEDKVIRISSDYTNGRKGVVVDVKGERAQVKWENAPKTWVNFKFLKKDI